MSVGLPGSGVGGVFYLLSALWMPFDNALRRSRASRLQTVATQSLLAVAIIGALYLTGLSIEHAVTAWTQHSGVTHGANAGVSAITPRIFKEATLAITLGTLSFVLLSVQVLRLVVARPGVAVKREHPKARRAA